MEGRGSLGPDILKGNSCHTWFIESPRVCGGQTKLLYFLVILSILVITNKKSPKGGPQKRKVTSSEKEGREVQKKI